MAAGWRALSAAITVGSAATVTAATRATPVLLRARPAPIVRTPAISQRRSTSATRDQMASAQNKASEYTMDSTNEAGATAHTATMTRLSRRSPISAMPSLVSPHAAARPAAMVTAKPARSRPIPGTQAIVSMASG